MKVVILENIRSAYNVGNIIRTADALGWKVRLSGYTPSPDEIAKVKKTSLGAEETVGIKQFNTTLEAIAYAKEQGMEVIAAEVTKGAEKLDEFSQKKHIGGIAVVFGNEVDGVLSATLKAVDTVIYIPMQGVKESLNVGQTSAIFMRELE
ncbi:MAG: RNA methyltransferase [candidate division SR1 bacterium CG_4_9_14_3_um_filter_40_9]|nr:MAG: RNA methyltransferase [candidate division SR1 bacterium CG_4_9_14_3_um_filter_40_9]